MLELKRTLDAKVTSIIFIVWKKDQILTLARLFLSIRYEQLGSLLA